MSYNIGVPAFEATGKLPLGRYCPGPEDTTAIMTEEQLLANRIRAYVIAAVLSVSLQGAFLVSALRSNGSTTAWILWVAAFAFTVAVVVYAMVRAGKLSKRYRYVKYGEK
jgi:hypothetical protein